MAEAGEGGSVTVPEYWTFHIECPHCGKTFEVFPASKQQIKIILRKQLKEAQGEKQA